MKSSTCILHPHLLHISWAPSAAQLVPNLVQGRFPINRLSTVVRFCQMFQLVHDRDVDRVLDTTDLAKINDLSRAVVTRATPSCSPECSARASFPPPPPPVYSTAEENLRLQEHVLRLRADVGRERMENASISESLTQAEARVSRCFLTLERAPALQKNENLRTRSLNVYSALPSHCKGCPAVGQRS